MAFDRKDWDIICEVLTEFEQKTVAKFEAYTKIYGEPYPTELQQEAVWEKEACELAQKLLKLQKDFIDMIKKGPPTTG